MNLLRVWVQFYHEKEVRTISSFVLAARGVWSLVIFIAANWTDLMLELKKRKEEPDRSESIFAASVRGSKISRLSDVQSLASDALDFNPHLNGLLRREILYYTTQGIKIAALEQQRDENGQLRSMGAWSAPLRPKGGSLFVSVAEVPYECLLTFTVLLSLSRSHSLSAVLSLAFFLAVSSRLSVIRLSYVIPSILYGWHFS